MKCAPDGHITCADCAHLRPLPDSDEAQCALTMERKPGGRVRGDQYCEKAEAKGTLIAETAETIAVEVSQ